MGDDRYRPISDYAFLSDCHSTALVSSHGSIDWACLRRFDAGSAFGRILDAEKGGYFSIGPVAKVTGVERRYQPHTMVLETTMHTDHGTVRCTDAFAMRRGGASRPTHELLRKVEALEGEVEVEIEIEPRFDHGATRPWLRHHDDGRCSAVGGNDALVLHCSIALDMDRERCRFGARTQLREGDVVATSLVSQAAHQVDTTAVDCDKVEAHLRTTRRWWTQWSKDTDVNGPHAEALERSAITLKGLTCAPTGAVVAAATTSLPEVPGGSANWDYRYSWVRDTTLAIEALAEVGHPDVAEGFRDFIMRSAAGHADELQIMFGPYGERSLPERELSLEGWRGAAPVRIGNDAATQIQLDVYGHLLEAAHLWQERADHLSDDEWAFLSSVVDQAVIHRSDADSGIWELRGPPRHYVHSKAMIWVALDRGISLVAEHGFSHGSPDRWRDARDEVRHEIETRGVDPDRGNFVQHYGSTELDANLLKLPLIGFIDAQDERMRLTTDAIIDELGTEPYGFLRRFRTDGDQEGVFLLCSCWLVEVLALQGRTDEATALFENLLAVGNDVGLYSEEAVPDGTEMLGNFPQAFTQLGLVSAEKRLRTI